MEQQLRFGLCETNVYGTVHALVTPRAVPLNLSPGVPYPYELHLQAPIVHLGKKQIEKIPSVSRQEAGLQHAKPGQAAVTAGQKVRTATGDVGGKDGWEFG